MSFKENILISASAWSTQLRRIKVLTSQIKIIKISTRIIIKIW
jgi:hypothetical protein